MDELVSGVIRRSDFSIKNEEDGQRVKRRRMVRKLHPVGGLVRKNRTTAASMIFEHYTGTEWRNNTVSRA